TKPRIVYDAAPAHLERALLLSEVLHQGPVLLPHMCDNLLRFRFGNTAVDDDVEK
ncbi:hypothetical protein Angca_000032, partial [Angiostrongylus cantonensis]